MTIIEKKKSSEQEGVELGLESSPAPGKNPVCIVCGLKAEFCMRGLPKNTYCRDCAEAYFELLDYLDKL
jgi:hypothetical protein